MSQSKYQRYICNLMLFMFFSLLFSTAYAQTLQERLNQQTDFIPQNAPPPEQLIEIAQRFKIPMAIEHGHSPLNTRWQFIPLTE